MNLRKSRSSKDGRSGSLPQPPLPGPPTAVPGREGRADIELSSGEEENVIPPVRAREPLLHHLVPPPPQLHRGGMAR